VFGSNSFNFCTKLLTEAKHEIAHDGRVNVKENQAPVVERYPGQCHGAQLIRELGAQQQGEFEFSGEALAEARHVDLDAYSPSNGKRPTHATRLTF